MNSQESRNPEKRAMVGPTMLEILSRQNSVMSAIPASERSIAQPFFALSCSPKKKREMSAVHTGWVYISRTTTATGVLTAIAVFSRNPRSAIMSPNTTKNPISFLDIAVLFLIAMGESRIRAKKTLKMDCWREETFLSLSRAENKETEPNIHPENAI
jgi:hypothetical protein